MKQGKLITSRNKEVMSNLEYDKMYDELLELEKKDEHCFIKQPNDPCRVWIDDSIGKRSTSISDVIIRQDKGARSAGNMLNGQEGILSWKLDGLTIVLTYEHGNSSKPWPVEMGKLEKL